MYQSEIQSSGSESSNTMTVSKQEKLNQLRKTFAGDNYQEKFNDESLGIIVFSRICDDGTLYLMGFSGRSAKTNFNYKFQCEGVGENFLHNWLDKKRKEAKEKTDRKDERAKRLAAPHPFNVGDVLYSTWGVDCTRYEYYQVVSVGKNRTMEIQQIAANETKKMGYCGECTPEKNKFLGSSFSVKVNEYDSVKINYGMYARKKEVKIVNGAEFFESDIYSSNC